LGAGGGGFLLVFCRPEKQPAVRQALSDLREMKFTASRQGSTVIYDDFAGLSNAVAAARP
jgi:D-glycero-alpha-D-manno-heptose-7-phosphate kinase